LNALRQLIVPDKRFRIEIRCNKAGWKDGSRYIIGLGIFLSRQKREWVVDGSIWKWKWKDGMGAGIFVVILEGVHRYVCLEPRKAN